MAIFSLYAPSELSDIIAFFKIPTIKHVTSELTEWPIARYDNYKKCPGGSRVQLYVPTIARGLI